MHAHDNNKNGGHKGMIWMMIPCLIMLGVLFLGGGRLPLGGYLWPILIGIFIVAHIWMMFKGHGGHSDADTEDKINSASAQQSDPKSDHKHSGGCH